MKQHMVQRFDLFSTRLTSIIHLHSPPELCRHWKAVMSDSPPEVLEFGWQV
ncbi:hypothetical protein F2Q69_00022968 [Brassica cretica]|uniref:Uncharacterized protein n=1 Tax=Brassica cretica TaxID=69181 RepID=A0A8S9QDJ5_BRACR|nr:hypothetical protein F2Q69_00022968 [Brassica cretica]